jgi:heat shock protein HspQ
MSPVYKIGQVIHHKRYGYRGVVFDRDTECEADEDWHLKNQTQPPRGQPWYHVLVHGADHTTYVAESNLEPDPSGEPIRHPLLNRFFSGFHDGHYYKASQN